MIAKKRLPHKEEAFKLRKVLISFLIRILVFYIGQEVFSVITGRENNLDD